MKFHGRIALLLSLTLSLGLLANSLFHSEQSLNYLLEELFESRVVDNGPADDLDSVVVNDAAYSGFYNQFFIPPALPRVFPSLLTVLVEARAPPLG